MMPSIFITAALTTVLLMKAFECSLHFGTSHIFRGLEKLKKRQDASSFEQHVCFDVRQLVAFKAQFTAFIDKDNDGRASFKEIKSYLQKYDPDVTEKRVQDFVVRRDTNGDGDVDFIPDYLSEISAPNYSASMAKEWFELEDSNHDGYVSRDELVNIAQNIGMSPREALETAEGYYMIADVNGDHRLTWNEYVTLFT
ncbi:calmodulin-like [Mytilus californianus]|uniref:calmodulin-like n=1 Tax=Mytilus californianus TaxID=6549 RepID=UPI00224839F0|nr:calmodulin-like [Mytilus californianus]